MLERLNTTLRRKNMPDKELLTPLTIAEVMRLGCNTSAHANQNKANYVQKETDLHSSIQSLTTSVYQSSIKNSDDLLTHKEMCDELGISTQTGYDWRNPKSPRYKEDLAKIAIYLSSRTVRFRRIDIQQFARKAGPNAK